MKTKEARTNKSLSMASKLNFRLWIRLVGLFLVLDLFLFATSAFVLVTYVERTVAKVVAVADNPLTLDQHSKELLAISGVSVVPLDAEPTGVLIPRALQIVFPESTADGRRRVSIGEEEEEPLLQRIDSLKYTVQRDFEGTPYEIVVELQSMVRLFKSIFFALLVFQFFHIFRSLFISGKIIGKTMRPIVELADKTQSLNAKRGPISQQEMEALAGTLKGINAARLDTRIEIDGAQDELKNVAGAINGMLARINASYGAQARFVSDASHELRTPIAAIQGYVNLLDRWGKHDKLALQESIDAIKDEAAHMKDLIEQLLFLARGDNHAMPLQQEQVSLAELSETVVRETQMIDDSHEFESRPTPVFVYADPSLIKQALRILVDNAIKYTPNGGRIVISLKKDDGKARITVQDNGIGIPPEAVPRIFDRFYRADESRARATGGTGLGLSIAKWIVERHGGHVEVLSRQDIGTRFTIVIPALDLEQKNPKSGHY